MKYLNVMVDCGNGYNGYSEIEKACIKNYGDSELNSKIYTTYNGNEIDLSKFDDGQFVLTDGTLVLFENTIGYPERVYISVDVNGYGKKPNKLGKDLFMFQLMKDGKLLPMGAIGTDYYSDKDEYCSNTSTLKLNGAGCTIKDLN